MTARLATRRVRRILAAAALLTVAAPAALLLAGNTAGAASSLDVYAVKAGGAGVRITVQTGYSFVVEPDAMIPRAAASIEAGAVSALASPLDPGDSVDALPGVGLPTAEQDIMNGAATPNPLPSPIGGQTPPPQFTQTVDGIVTNYVAPFNPLLTVPYEHAFAGYPNATGAPQRAVYPPPVPTSSNGAQLQAPALPDFADPLGLVSVHSTLGEAQAGPGSGVADSGIGSAVSIPALGLSIGRISSHVEVHGGTTSTGGAATSTVVTTLQNVDLATTSASGLPLPNGTALLHIGTLVLTATTERTPGAAHATSKSTLEASGVSVAGQSARLDENGLTVLGQPSALNPLAKQIVDTVNSLSGPQCTPNPPIGVPNLGTITSQPVMKIGLPQVQSQVTHGGNEASVSLTGPTLCIATTAPIPGTNGVAATPTIYTVTLGDVSSSAYGISFPAEATSIAPLPPPLPETGVAGATGGIDTSTIITNPGASSTPPPAPTQRPLASRGLAAILTGGILSPQVVVTMATLAELALLATLWLSYRLAAAARADDASAASRMDMV